MPFLTQPQFLVGGVAFSAQAPAHKAARASSCLFHRTMATYIIVSHHYLLSRGRTANLPSVLLVRPLENHLQETEKNPMTNSGSYRYSVIHSCQKPATLWHI